MNTALPPTRTLRPEDLVAHLDYMRRAALGMTRSWHEAEDLVQETCAQLLAKPRVVGHDGALGYVLTALRNTHIDRRRAAVRRPLTVELHDDVEVDRMSTFARVRGREVHAWLDELPAHLREAIVAVDVVGLSRAEAARGLGTTERELGDRLARARVSMGARLCA
jgi:RNA polymerase sigma-70 factor (ECF subfamily)